MVPFFFSFHWAYCSRDSSRWLYVSLVCTFYFWVVAHGLEIPQFTGIPRFIVLHFIAHHRCFFFYKLKARPSSTSKKITTQFIAIFNFSGPEPNLQYRWHMPVLNPSPVEEYLGYFQFGAVTWLKLLYTVMYTFLCKHKFSFIWDKCLGVQIQGCVVVAYLMF